jgi:uncharacterized protein (TIGR02246 family)
MPNKCAALGTCIALVFALSVTNLIPDVHANRGLPDSVDLSNQDVAAIVEIAKDFSQAYEAGDVGRMMEFYSPDVIYMAQGMPNHEGREILKKIYQQLFSNYRGHVDVQIEEVKILGDMAFDRARFTSTLTPKAGGEVVVSKGRLLEVLKKENGKWKSLRVMVNSEE